MSEYDPVKAVETADARDKVIEAAKALLVDGLPLQIRMDRLTDAVAALLALEKGEE